MMVKNIRYFPKTINVIINEVNIHCWQLFCGSVYVAPRASRYRPPNSALVIYFL